METNQVYEKVMGYYFNRIKHLRNQWTGNQNYKKTGLETLIDIEGNDQRMYRLIMKKSTEYTYEMLAGVIRELMRVYEIPVQYYDLRRSTAYVYYIGENRDFLDNMYQSDENRVLAFSRKDTHKEVLFIFKKYGIGEHLPPKTIEMILKALKIKEFCYISYTEEDAFSEVVNHNDDENDLSRGTGIYSIRQFFDMFFGEDEFLKFRKHADAFTQEIRDYFGFELLRTIKPNTLNSFKKTVRDDLLKLSMQIDEMLKNISDEQRQIMDEHFFRNKNYEVLLGDCDFAQSYMTAEWLYYSLSNAGNIDLTSIVMGYYKAIEQFLFRFIKLHTHEKDGFTRMIFTGKNDSDANESGYAPVSDSLMNDNERNKHLSLGSLTGFFGYYNNRSKKYIKRNIDLLNDGIDNQTYEQVVDMLDGIVGLRNGFFHKDNLSDREVVRSARNTALLVFYIFLGAYRISEDEKLQLGLIPVGKAFCVLVKILR